MHTNASIQTPDRDFCAQNMYNKQLCYTNLAHFFKQSGDPFQHKEAILPLEEQDSFETILSS